MHTIVILNMPLFQLFSKCQSSDRVFEIEFRPKALGMLDFVVFLFGFWRLEHTEGEHLPETVSSTCCCCGRRPHAKTEAFFLSPDELPTACVRTLELG